MGQIKKLKALWPNLEARAKIRKVFKVHFIFRCCKIGKKKWGQSFVNIWLPSLFFVNFTATKDEKYFIYCFFGGNETKKWFWNFLTFKDSNIADNADGYFRKLADCIIEIEITVFQNFALICQLVTKNQAFEIASEMRRLSISATFFRQSLKQAEDSFIAWSLNFIFEVMEDHIKPELNPNPYIR